MQFQVDLYVEALHKTLEENEAAFALKCELSYFKCMTSVCLRKEKESKLPTVVGFFFTLASSHKVNGRFFVRQVIHRER